MLRQRANLPILKPLQKWEIRCGIACRQGALGSFIAQ